MEALPSRGPRRVWSWHLYPGPGETGLVMEDRGKQIGPVRGKADDERP